MVLAGLSALIITGILGFMLTSDGWPWDRSFWGAFFNPTFLPQLAWRLSEALVMGAAFVMIFLLFWHRDLALQREALRLYATILAGAAVPMAASGWWWFHVVPSSFKTHAVFAFQMMTGLRETPWFWAGHVVLVGLVALAVAAGWLRSGVMAKLLILPATFGVLVFAAEYEWVREFIRGPYLMPGYMYANTVLLSEHELFRQEGMLKHAYWYNRLAQTPSLEEEGAFLFAQNCGTCHTIGGRNDIRARFRGKPEDAIFVILGRTEQMIPFMPAFSGTDEERTKLARFITQLQRQAVHLEAPARYTRIPGQEQQ